MISSPEKTKIAVIGPGGIGAVHLRVLIESGAELRAIVSSSMESAYLASEKIEAEFNIQTTPYCSFREMLLQEEITAVSICAPPDKHYQYIVEALNSNLAVFCEKPLFWHPGETIDETNQKLLFLKNHKNRRIFVNTCNSSFLDVLDRNRMKRKQFNSFYFRFYTQGKYRYKGIGQDLLPHGLSLLLELVGKQKIQNIKSIIEKHSFICRFDYGDIDVNFDFHEESGWPKEFVFKIDEHEYERVQTGLGKTYKVFIKDHMQNILIPVEDPFKIFINDFVLYCGRGIKPKDDTFIVSAENLLLMCELLL